MDNLLKNINNINSIAVDYNNVYIPSQHMWADTQFELLKEQIQQYESSLDAEYEVGIYFTNFGQSVLMQVLEISYKDPVLIIFKGIVDDKESVLIQHINQLNFLLTKVVKEPDRPKRKIGFI